MTILSVDAGTTGVTALIVDKDGQIISRGYSEFPQHFPQEGWVEHDPMEILSTQLGVAAEALTKQGLRVSDVAAIGITNQRETTVVWNRATGQPVHNAIVWQDTRTQTFLNSLSAQAKEKITFKTGLAIAPYFSASKMNWFIKNKPEVATAISKGNALVGTIDSWLVWNLTGGTRAGVHITDVTNASRTLLMNLETLDWDGELLELFAVPRSILPAIKSSSEIYGNTDPAGPFGTSIPISGILGDQQAAMVGQACFARGESKTTYGTGNFALVNTGTEIVRSKNGLLTTVCFKFGSEPTHYALEGSVAVTGSAIQWLRDQLQIIGAAPDVEALASSVVDNGGVYFVPAFSGLFAPYWRNDARGVIVGLTRAATKAHIARAALEAICYQTREVLDAMAADSGVKLPEMRVDGGITANSLCMQMQSDIMGIDVVRPQIIETTALGAAYAAGLAVGVYKDVSQLRSQWKEGRRWSANKTSDLATTGFNKWKKAIERTLNWVD